MIVVVVVVIAGCCMQSVVNGNDRKSSLIVRIVLTVNDMNSENDGRYWFNSFSFPLDQSCGDES